VCSDDFALIDQTIWYDFEEWHFAPYPDDTQVVLQSSPIESITNSSLEWEFQLPKVNLPPSHHRGISLRCIYFVEVEIGQPEGDAIKKFRVPIVVGGPLTDSFTIPKAPSVVDWIRIVH
jgi:hypothetical protein